MNILNEFLAQLDGWKKCRPPRWFDEFRLRRKIGFPNAFSIKGKKFKYKAFKKYEENQGDGLDNLYQFYKKKK